MFSGELHGEDGELEASASWPVVMHSVTSLLLVRR